MGKVIRRIATIAGVLLGGFVLFVFASLFFLGRNQPTTAEVSLGVSGGAFNPCPDTPNCVSTMAAPSNRSARVEPIAISGGGEAVIEELASWIEEHPRGSVETRRPGYLHATFSSPTFGFIDDLELYLPPQEELLHLRSAARVGRSDMGVNRERYAEIRALLE